MSSQNIYCVYLTIYRGNKLPPFYIGSTSISKIQKGYKGSVSSKQYKNLWDFEIKNNQHLFKTKIVSYHKTRQEALEKEFILHTKLNVVKNILYINKSTAKKNGFFGMDVSGKNNPMYGKSRNDSSIRMKTNNPMFDKEIAKKVAESKKLKRKLGLHKPTAMKEYGRKQTSQRMKTNNPAFVRFCCLYCGKEIPVISFPRHSKSKYHMQARHSPVDAWTPA